MIKVEIEIDSPLYYVNKNICRNLISIVFSDIDIKNAFITIIFGGDKLLNLIKKEFFGKDHLTDVISFRLDDNQTKNIEGEIYISFPRAKENAKNFKVPFEKEIARLIIHGLLHLVGYRDDTSKLKQEMTFYEDKYLENETWKDIFLDKKKQK